MTRDEILARFEGARRSGAGFQARCPAHDDRRSSLSLTPHDDKVLLHCHAGCRTEDVLAAAGLTLADLFTSPNGNGHGRAEIVAEYDYSDEAGERLYQAVRLAPKDFRQRRPDPAGGWIWSLGDTRRVLFHLPQLQGAELVLVVEGEKDVLTAEAWGLVATCNAGGAGKWRIEYVEQLLAAGVRQLVVVPDNDAPGRQHAQVVAAACLDAGLEVRVVELPDLPPKGDLSDFARTHTKADLEALIAAAPTFTPAENEPSSCYDIHDQNDQTPLSCPVPSSEGGVWSYADRGKPEQNQVWSCRSFLSYPGEWPKLDPAALVGLPGELVRLVAPHTEADPAALVATTLAMAGSAIGRTPGFQVGADVHHTNLYALIVGPTSTGRKGTAWSEVRRVMADADPDWADACITAGLSSGEGLIHCVRDPVEAQEPIREKGRVVDYQTVVKDPGITDKRALIIEQEFASVLRVARRDGSTLSPTIRQAWDTGRLKVLTKQSPEQATHAHISIVGHITAEELAREMTSTDLANGLANRFLYIASRRAQLLPHGGQVDGYARAGLALAFGRAFALARTRSRLTWNTAAAARWTEVYAALTTDRPGLAGAVTARTAPQAIRLALIYALLDEAAEIRPAHLEAALALCRYSMETAAMLFGTKVGDPMADYILAMLRDAPHGVTRTAIRDAFGRNKSVEEIDGALSVLVRHGLAARSFDASDRGGRPAERWRALTFGAPAVAAPTPLDTPVVRSA